MFSLFNALIMLNLRKKLIVILDIKMLILDYTWTTLKNNICFYYLNGNILAEIFFVK